MRYDIYMWRSLFPFTASRIVPYCGITLLLAMIAHNRPSDLAFIAYVLAIYSVLAVMVSMSLAATGNLVAEHANSPHEKMSLFRGGLSVAVILASIALLVSFGLVMLTDCFPGAQMGVGKVKFWRLSTSVRYPY